jgi:hypothetical protein
VLQELLTFVVIFFLVLGAATAVGIGLTLRALHRANRVTASKRSRAPLAWLWSWREPARLHRRLRRAVQSSGMVVVAGASSLQSLAAEIAERAATVDDELVETSRLHPFWRRQVMVSLTSEVRELERSAFQLNRLMADWRARIHQLALSEAVPPLDLQSRIQAIDAALAEVTAVGRVSPTGR